MYKFFYRAKNPHFYNFKINYIFGILVKNAEEKPLELPLRHPSLGVITDTLLVKYCIFSLGRDIDAHLGTLIRGYFVMNIEIYFEIL